MTNTLPPPRGARTKCAIAAAALAATLASSGCMTALAIASSAAAKDDEPGATGKRIVFGVVMDAVLIGGTILVLGAAIGAPFEGAGGH